MAAHMLSKSKRHLARTPTDIGNVLSRRRSDKNLTQSQSAKLGGVGRDSVSRIENGAPGARLETLFRLVTASNLGVVITDRTKFDTRKFGEIF